MAKEPKSLALQDPLEDLLGYQLRRASLATFPAVCRSFEALGLKMTEAAIIRFVEANPGCNQGQIGDALGMKRTNMVPIVAGLVESGLIRRAAADGRTHALHLTDEGRSMHGRVAEAALEQERYFFADMAEGTKTLLLAACRSIRNKAEER